MKGEYFPPREDVILQNEAPTDLYVLVSGVVVSIGSFLYSCMHNMSTCRGEFAYIWISLEPAKAGPALK